MKKITLMLVFVLLGCLVLPVCAQALSWTHDIAVAKRKAKSTGKPIMVDFYTDWCGWCKKLDSETYADSRIKSLAKKFVCAKIDGDKHKDLVKKYKVTGYPTILFLDNNGNFVKKIPGFVDADKLAPIMTKIAGTIKPIKSAQPSLMSKIMNRIKPQAIESGADSKGKFTLNGMIGGVGGKRAIVNDTVVGEGDSVDGATVESITGGSVVLDHEGQKIKLNMKN